ncbi:MAG: ShlB/FhaC/HecB family hemolysin secretion/activation protein [Microbacteriaceae bacterium]|nr:ShlB/FhaC/HecB family hemolysin secretion/activation protein [Burkholderiaceae bacterium]
MQRLALPAWAAPAAPSPADDSGLRLRLTAFRFSLNSRFSAQRLGGLLDDLLGLELGLSGLQAAADRITAFYRQQGYFLALAFVPAQDIADGVVEITVLEGRLGQVRLDNQSGIADAIVRGRLAPLQPGQPLAADTLERSLLLINSLAGAQVQSTLTPGASVGTSDLDIRVDALPRTAVSIGLDNYGNRFSGAWRAHAALSVNSPLDSGDALSLQTTRAGPLFQHARLAYQWPLGQHGLQVGAAGSAMAYRLGHGFAALQAHGRADIASVYALWPWLSARNLNVKLQVNVEHKRLADRTDSVNSASDKTVDALILGGSGDRVDGLGGSGASSWSLSLTNGRLRLDAPAAAGADTGQRTGGRFAKLSWLAARQQQLPVLGADWSLWAQFSGQASLPQPATGDAARNLDSSEKFSLGGAQGVRAYPQGEAPADDAWLATIELRRALGSAWQLSGFVDTAMGRPSHTAAAPDDANLRRLSGVGLGSSYVQPGGLSWGATVAWRTSGPPRSDHDRSPRLWSSLQQQF